MNRREWIMPSGAAMAARPKLAELQERASRGLSDTEVATSGKLLPMVHVRLDGQWSLFCFPQGKYRVAHPNELSALGLASIEASVPGDAMLDLSRKGGLPADLFNGENIRKLQPYELFD